MTGGAQRTREMLNILINWLRDHTLWHQSCRTHLKPEAVNNNPPPHLPLMLSIPHVFITLLFFSFISPAQALRRDDSNTRV